MTWKTSRAAIAAAALILAASIAPATAHSQPVSNTPGPANTVPGVRRDTSSSKYALPSIRMGGWGVRSKAPRGIGKIGGSLLPPPVNTPGPRRMAIPDNDFQPLPGGGGLVRGRDGRWTPSPWGGVRDGAGVSIGSSGVDANVIASGDRWAIAAALRSAVGFSWLNRRWRNDYYCGSYDGVYGGSYYDSWYPSAFNADVGMVDSFVARGNPAPVPPPAVDPDAGLTVLERAAKRLHEGRPDEAVVLLRSYTDAYPNEPEAARTLALALLDARRTKEGVAVMALVYERNPALAWTPIAPDAVGQQRELRDLVVRAVEFGHRTNSSSAWLTVAVLMQGEGREDPAFKMIERAGTLGLDADVSKAMRIALKP